MREILFRGKELRTGRWIEGYLYKHSGVNPIRKTCVIFENGGQDLAFSSRRDVDPETVGQYTGLTDKNGKKIFENVHIVKFKCLDEYISKWVDLIGVFTYSEEDLGYEIDVYNNSQFICLTYIADGTLKDFEILGTKQDNLELLEEIK